MTALIVLEEKGKERMGICVLSGVRFLKVVLPRAGMLSGYFARHAARKLQKAGITRAVFAQDFPYSAVFEKYGVQPCEVRRLRLAAARQIVCAALRQKGIAPENAHVAIAAERLNSEVQSLVEGISAVVRHLSLDAPEADVFAEQMRFRCGVALQLVKAQCAAAQMVLSLKEKHEAGVLALLDEGLSVAYALPPELAEEKVEKEQFLAAILDGGGIKAEEIEVLGIDTNGTEAIS